MPRIDALLREGAGRLQLAGVDSPEFDARELLLFAAGCDRPEELRLLAQIDDAAARQYAALLEKRAARIPLQYLLGFWEFYGRRFAVREGVLVPRPDTERLIDAALSLALPKHPAMLDLCSGSGAIAITLALEMGGEADAVELSGEAYPVLEENIALHGAAVRAIRADVCEWVPQRRYHLIVSNPPYVREDELDALQPEVRHEPRMALAAGDDGLCFYRVIARRYAASLLPGGVLLFEAGAGQAADIAAILRANGFGGVFTVRDYGGIERVVGGAMNVTEPLFP